MTDGIIMIIIMVVLGSFFLGYALALIRERIRKSDEDTAEDEEIANEDIVRCLEELHLPLSGHEQKMVDRAAELIKNMPKEETV